MSYWVSLLDPSDRSFVTVTPHQEGGTYAVGGIGDATLNVTYNYALQYGRHGFSLRDLNGHFAESVIPRLRELVAALGRDSDDDDYWKATPGNAGHALAILLAWAEQHPKAIFVVH